jgi:hypothetical protein
MPAVKILLELVEDVGFHGTLLVLVERVPADAHDHAVYGPPVHGRQAPVDTAHQLAGQSLYHLLGEVGRREPCTQHNIHQY